jgi:hypothetical protein
MSSPEWTTHNADADGTIKELMGLFDTPAFARRGQDLEHSLRRIHALCRRLRDQHMEMVRVRLRQWSRVAAGPEDWRDVFAEPIDGLWKLALAEPPVWGGVFAAPKQKRSAAANLIASARRFNGKWQQMIDLINLEPTNRVIDEYNKYYVIEKECVMGSARLAQRHFTPTPRLTCQTLLREHPLLPVPELITV